MGAHSRSVPRLQGCSYFYYLASLADCVFVFSIIIWLSRIRSNFAATERACPATRMCSAHYLFLCCTGTGCSLRPRRFPTLFLIRNLEDSVPLCQYGFLGLLPTIDNEHLGKGAN